MRFELIDCKPVPAKLAPAIRQVKADTGATLTSCARTQAAVDFARSKGCSLSSQAELVALFLSGRGNPANPVGRSTHEGKNDGAAYRWWAPFFNLPWWAWGQDWGSREWAEKVVAAYRRHGWVASITYPTNPREGHHVNLRKAPRYFRVLEKGVRAPRKVRLMTGRLAYLGYLKGVSPRRGTPRFGPKVAEALKAYQREHGLKPDGAYGEHTHHQLLVSVRRRKANRKKAKR